MYGREKRKTLNLNGASTYAVGVVVGVGGRAVEMVTPASALRRKIKKTITCLL